MGAEVGSFGLNNLDSAQGNPIVVSAFPLLCFMCPLVPLSIVSSINWINLLLYIRNPLETIRLQREWYQLVNIPLVCFPFLTLVPEYASHALLQGAAIGAFVQTYYLYRLYVHELAKFTPLTLSLQIQAELSMVDTIAHCYNRHHWSCSCHHNGKHGFSSRTKISKIDAFYQASVLGKTGKSTNWCE